MNREEILSRYRLLRDISVRHHGAALEFLSTRAILDHARKLRLRAGNAVVAESDEEMTLIFDLALYTAAQGRSRALDRYSRAGRLPPRSDEARMLEAMKCACFSIWRIERRHDTAGLIVSDVLRSGEKWLIDEGIEASGWEGMSFAARLCTPEDFSMTSGVIVPVDRPIMEVALDDLAWRSDNPDEVAADPRFAAAIYRAAIAGRVMENVRYA